MNIQPTSWPIAMHNYFCSIAGYKRNFGGGYKIVRSRLTKYCRGCVPGGIDSPETCTFLGSKYTKNAFAIRAPPQTPFTAFRRMDGKKGMLGKVRERKGKEIGPKGVGWVRPPPKKKCGYRQTLLAGYMRDLAIAP